MTPAEQKRALACAVKAAKAAGTVMRKNLFADKKITASWQHDIKLELDVQCQELIEEILYANFPEVALLGEEGVAGDANAEQRWVVDPIDGTVNFTHTIPHACVSIALQVQEKGPWAQEGVCHRGGRGVRSILQRVVDGDSRAAGVVERKDHPGEPAEEIERGAGFDGVCEIKGEPGPHPALFQSTGEAGAEGAADGVGGAGDDLRGDGAV